ncbi:hypothetical protein [Thermoanaerobacterium sp. DL9XJH110]|uniref:hypothetical protein n=1 Tax=Thermoanaerobacterium sp. DL9XJH110 TaxID=3386643 RepID=UPI003BB6788B
MNETCIKLVACMIVNTMAGRQKQTWDLYKQYVKERYLHVTIQEILDAKNRERTA